MTRGLQQKRPSLTSVRKSSRSRTPVSRLAKKTTSASKKTTTASGKPSPSLESSTESASLDSPRLKGRSALSDWPARGAKVLADLQRDFGLTREQAAGIVGNIGFESTGFTQLHEIGQPEGRGGYGWAQWTADRRVTFFDYCREKGLDWTSDEANYGYLCEELRDPEMQAHSLEQLRKTKDLD